ncbi:unnamed protein product [Prorocentrum cordatum]|uniref:Uncharacterized protein n=1 Tax=Prorocentrum cordatum TaxID=2364126 RepID=A0ABN9QQF4_9DINO|nr:unnamed protein product [Polarella glacialis]
MEAFEVQRHQGPVPQVRPHVSPLTVSLFILVVEVCERFCYYTLQGTLRNFLMEVGPTDAQGKRGLSQGAATAISACFSMLAYLTCILGGWMSDNVLGRYRTILYFSAVYVIGAWIHAIAAWPSIMRTAASLPISLMGLSLFIAVGTGTIKPNVMSFGADQFDTTDSVQKAQQKQFFTIFYASINIGSFMAVGFTVNLATSGITKDSAGSGFFWAGLIAALSMLCANITFVAGVRFYKGRDKPQHAPMLQILSRRLTDAASRSVRGKIALLGWGLIPVSMAIVMVGSMATDFDPRLAKAMSWTGFAMSALSCAMLIAAHHQNDFIAPLPAQALQESDITASDVTEFLSCVPTMFCISVGFGIPYNAASNVYAAQACQMDVRLFGTQVNGGFFNLANAVAIVCMAPIVAVIMLRLEQALQRPVTLTEKATSAFAFVISANFSAVIIEFIRKEMSLGSSPNFVPCPQDRPENWQCTAGDVYLLSKCTPNGSIAMTNMSAMWMMIPQFLTGVGELLCNPVMYQFLYDEAPARLTSLAQALNLVCAGAISNAITAAFGALVPEDFNKGSLNYFYYASMAVAASFLAVYWVVKLPEKAPPEPTPPEEQRGLLVSTTTLESAKRA